MKLDRIIAVRNRKTVFRDGERCLKMFDRNYNTADILKEAMNHARIEECGLMVPKLLEVAPFDDHWTIVTAHIKGKTMAQRLQSEPEKTDEYLELFVKLHNEVHQKRSAGLERLHQELARLIRQADFTATVRCELQAKLESLPRDRAVCHGDFSPSNIIMTDTGESYIIDWSRVTQGNRAADIARTYLHFKLSGEFDSDLFLRKICQVGELTEQDVLDWLPIVAAARSAIGNAAERAALAEWIGERS